MSRFTNDVLDGDPLLTSIEIGELLRVDPKTVTRRVGRGLLPAIKTPGGQIRVRQSAILPLLDSP